jgi:hypothetical protein
VSPDLSGPSTSTFLIARTSTASSEGKAIRQQKGHKILRQYFVTYV